MVDGTKQRNTDLDLRQRMRLGDADAMAEFIQLHRPRLLSRIDRNLRLLRRRLEPDDILQEVTITAIRLLPKAQFDRRGALGWLFQLIQWQMVGDYRRFFVGQKRSAFREVAADNTARQDLVRQVAVSLTTPSARFAREERERDVWNAVAQLSPHYREVLVLRYVEGLTTRHIAKRLGKSHGATRIMISRALKCLKERLQ